MKKKTSSRDSVDLMQTIPHARAGCEEDGPGKLVLVKPKIERGPFIGLLRYLKKPNHRIHLDEIGSFVWRQIDGETTVGTICERASAEFGERIHPVAERVSLFIRRLVRGGLIDLENPASRHNPPS